MQRSAHLLGCISVSLTERGGVSLQGQPRRNPMVRSATRYSRSQMALYPFKAVQTSTQKLNLNNSKKSIQTSPWKTASNHRQRSNQPKRKGSKKTAGCILGKVKKLRIHASYHSQEAFQRSGSAPVMRNCATTALQITQKLNNHSMGWLRADRRVRKGWLVTEERETFPDWRTTSR